MLKLSKLSDYAVVTLYTLNTYGDQSIAASTLASSANLPEPTVAKILKLLGTGGLVTSTRGVKGGYTLAMPLNEISIKNVINALDGPIALTACVETSADECELAPKCAMRGRWDQVNRAIKSALESVSIADMMAAEPQKFKVKEHA